MPPDVSTKRTHTQTLKLTRQRPASQDMDCLMQSFLILKSDPLVRFQQTQSFDLTGNGVVERALSGILAIYSMRETVVASCGAQGSGSCQVTSRKQEGSQNPTCAGGDHK